MLRQADVEALEAEIHAMPLAEQMQALKALKALWYWTRPVEWIRDFVRFPKGQHLAPYQEEILAQLPVVKRASVRGPHTLGKTTVMALAVLWFAETREGTDWKIITTASAWRQLRFFLWPEVHKWARLLDWEKLGTTPWRDGIQLLDMGIKLDTGQAVAVASDRADQIEGAHADNLLYLLDESKAVPAETFDAVEGAFAGAGGDTSSEAYALSVSTPGEPAGRFYDIQSRKARYADWWVRAVSREEAIAVGRMSKEWAAARLLQWGEESAIYQNRVAGNFASSDEDAVIPLSWVEAAVQRWQDLHDADAFELPPFTCVGVDVARSGPAHTVHALRYGNVIEELRDRQHKMTTETTGEVVGVLRAHPEGYASVDVNGVGAGVVDQLREQGLDVEAFSAGSRASDGWVDITGELLAHNRRAEAWWTLRELLHPELGAEIALPPDETLIGDLTAPHYRIGSGGRILVEKKEEVEKRIDRSTDFGDAVVQAFVARVFPDEETVVTWEPDYTISPF